MSDFTVGFLANLGSSIPWLVKHSVKRQRLRGTTKFGNHKTKSQSFWLPIRKFRTCISNEIQNGIGSLSPLENLIFSPKSNEREETGF